TGEEPDDVRDRSLAGLDAGGDLRDWDLPDREVRIESAAAAPDRFTTAVVVAAYGESEPVFSPSA
ncbi:pyruvoyl-dependent arginine decarboxylase subunit alpha, partial [Halorubrum saccharovorum]